MSLDEARGVALWCRRQDKRRYRQARANDRRPRLSLKAFANPLSSDVHHGQGRAGVQIHR